MVTLQDGDVPDVNSDEDNDPWWKAQLCAMCEDGYTAKPKDALSFVKVLKQVAGKQQISCECRFCGLKFTTCGSARCFPHLAGVKGQGIDVCPVEKIPKSVRQVKRRNSPKPALTPPKPAFVMPLCQNLPCCTSVVILQ